MAVSSFRVTSCGNRHDQTQPRVQHGLPSSNVSNSPLLFLGSLMEPDFENFIQQAMTQAHDAAGSPLPHPDSTMLIIQFQVLPFLKRFQKQFFFFLQWSTLIDGIWADLNFILPYFFLILLCISHEIKELHIILTFVIIMPLYFVLILLPTYTCLNNKFLKFACFEIICKSLKVY